MMEFQIVNAGGASDYCIGRSMTSIAKERAMDWPVITITFLWSI